MAHFQSFALNAPTVHRHLKMSMTYNVTQKLFILTTQEKENTVESLKAIHKKIKEEFKCTICDVKFSRKNGLARHNKKH